MKTRKKKKIVYGKQSGNNSTIKSRTNLVKKIDKKKVQLNCERKRKEIQKYSFYFRFLAKIWTRNKMYNLNKIIVNLNI